MLRDDHEVWAHVPLANLKLHEEAGTTVERLLEGLPFDEAGLRRRKRVAWSDHATICERLAEAAGGHRELEDLVAGSYHRVTPEIRSIAAAVVSPAAFYRFVLEVLHPIIIPPVAIALEELGDNRIRVGARLHAGARPSEAYFHGSTGALRAFSAHLGLPTATVLSAEISPSHGLWDLELPPARTLLRRAYRRAQRLMLSLQLGSEPDGTPVSVILGTDDIDPVAARLDRMVNAWRLTPRQGEVLSLVVAGRTNKEIANELGCAENTIELHVTRILRKTGTTSRTQLIAHFWADDARAR